MKNKRKEELFMKEYFEDTELTEEQWEDVMFDFFPNAESEEELEDELDSWFND